MTKLSSENVLQSHSWVHPKAVLSISPKLFFPGSPGSEHRVDAPQDNLSSGAQTRKEMRFQTHSSLADTDIRHASSYLSPSLAFNSPHSLQMTLKIQFITINALPRARSLIFRICRVSDLRLGSPRPHYIQLPQTTWHQARNISSKLYWTARG